MTQLLSDIIKTIFLLLVGALLSDDILSIASGFLPFYLNTYLDIVSHAPIFDPKGFFVGVYEASPVGQVIEYFVNSGEASADEQ